MMVRGVGLNDGHVAPCTNNKLQIKKSKNLLL